MKAERNNFFTQWCFTVFVNLNSIIIILLQKLNFFLKHMFHLIGNRELTCCVGRYTQCKGLCEMSLDKNKCFNLLQNVLFWVTLHCKAVTMKDIIWCIAAMQLYIKEGNSVNTKCQWDCTVLVLLFLNRSCLLPAIAHSTHFHTCTFRSAKKLVMWPCFTCTQNRNTTFSSAELDQLYLLHVCGLTWMSEDTD